MITFIIDQNLILIYLHDNLLKWFQYYIYLCEREMGATSNVLDPDLEKCYSFKV